jgi:prepilin-type N-terminal cleavage/methylation domain-containing protein
MILRQFHAPGFTLVELLVVMAILATLVGLGVVGLPRMLRAGDEKLTATALTALVAALEGYQNDPKHGDYPPTVLEPDTFLGVGPRQNDENLGVESLVLCLSRRGINVAISLDQIEGLTLDNLDGDSTQGQVTVFGDRGLYELVDRWGTPLAYFHSRDYAAVESQDLGRITGADGVVKAVPYRSKKTRSFLNRDSFQVFSAGPDRVFNTDDDITPFKRE